MNFDIEDFNYGSTTRGTVRENQSSRRCCKEAQRAKGRKVFGKVIIHGKRLLHHIRISLGFVQVKSQRSRENTYRI